MNELGRLTSEYVRQQIPSGSMLRRKEEKIVNIDRLTVWKGNFVMNQGSAGFFGLSLTASCDSENFVEIQSCLSSKDRDLAGVERILHLKYSSETSSTP